MLERLRRTKGYIEKKLKDYLRRTEGNKDIEELLNYLRRTEEYKVIIEKIKKSVRNPDEKAADDFALAVVSDYPEYIREILQNPNFPEAYRKFEEESKRTGMPSPEYVDELISELLNG